MNKDIKGFIIGFAVTALIGSGVVIARNSQETIDAAYQNIKLVVDGVTVEPKDASGNVVEPFIYNGTTYLPVRAVGSAFGKDVTWDGNTATVDLHTPGEREKKEVDLYNRPYTVCEDPNNTEFYQKDGAGYIWCEPSSNHTESDTHHMSNSVTYPLNGKADYVTGEFYLSYAGDATEGILKICNGSGKVLYTSPIMRKSTAPITFNVPVVGEQSVKFIFESTTAYKSSDREMVIKNPKIFTSDY